MPCPATLPGFYPSAYSSLTRVPYLILYSLPDLTRLPCRHWPRSFTRADNLPPLSLIDPTLSFSSKFGLHLWQNHLGKGFITRINLSDSRRSENTNNTHKYNSTYWSSSRSYYNLGSRISYIEEVWSQNYASGDKSEFVKPISLNGQNILFVLKENAIHGHSKTEDPSMESPHQFGLPTNNPRQLHWQEEAVPHLHIEDSKSKAWATMLRKTYPWWPKNHL
jgi:hypothetical protein